jgi:hypothetical protein
MTLHEQAKSRVDIEWPEEPPQYDERGYLKMADRPATLVLSDTYGQDIRVELSAAEVRELWRALGSGLLRGED